MLQEPRSQEETPCTRTEEVSWETLLNKGRKPSQILCCILQEKYLHHQENLEHKRVLANPRRLVLKRGAHFSQVDVLAEISKLTQRYDSSMGNLPVLILDLTCQQKYLLAQHG
jgi:hypothetical protein